MKLTTFKSNLRPIFWTLPFSCEYVFCIICFYSVGMDVRELGEIDGIDMWDSLVDNKESPRTEFVYNIDDIGDVYAAIRHGDWKYITGNYATNNRAVIGLLCHKIELQIGIIAGKQRKMS